MFEVWQDKVGLYFDLLEVKRYMFYAALTSLLFHYLYKEREVCVCVCVFYLFIKYAPLLWSNTTYCDLHVSSFAVDAVTNIVASVIAFPLQF
jgi:hypothetical protein